MAKLGTDPYKGVRDFYPEDMAIQNYIFNTWRKVAEKFEYVEYGASILEPAELYKGKTSEEIVNDQTFSFTDRGGREVILRPEMTPTLARMIAAERKSLKFPLRWFSIPNVFRYERPQRGRRREHWQLNCDLLGIPGIEADVEIISLAHAILRAFGAEEKDFEIRINSRKALPKGVSMETIRKIDKGEEVGIEVRETDEIRSVLDLLEKKGIKNARFNQKIVRGFDYYTGIVFEIFDVDPIPAVGFGMGDITLRDFLETHKLKLNA